MVYFYSCPEPEVGAGSDEASSGQLLYFYRLQILLAWLYLERHPLLIEEDKKIQDTQVTQPPQEHKIIN